MRRLAEVWLQKSRMSDDSRLSARLFTFSLRNLKNSQTFYRKSNFYTQRNGPLVARGKSFCENFCELSHIQRGAQN